MPMPIIRPRLSRALRSERRTQRSSANTLSRATCDSILRETAFWITALTPLPVVLAVALPQEADHARLVVALLRYIQQVLAAAGRRRRTRA